MELTAEHEPVVTAPTRYKMTTDIPDRDHRTGQRLETRLGTLHYSSMACLKQYVQTLYDNLDFQHGCTGVSSRFAGSGFIRVPRLAFGPLARSIRPC